MKKPARACSWKICYADLFMKLLVIVVTALALLGCSGQQAPTVAATPAAASGAAGVKQYPMHGKIVSVNPAEKSAKIDAGPIGDWMAAMTMDYTIKDPAELAKVSAGQTIDATVFVNGDDVWVGNISVGNTPPTK